MLHPRLLWNCMPQSSTKIGQIYKSKKLSIRRSRMVYRATTPVPFMTLKTSQLAVRFNGFKYSTFCIFTFFFKIFNSRLLQTCMQQSSTKPTRSLFISIDCSFANYSNLVVIVLKICQRIFVCVKKIFMISIFFYFVSTLSKCSVCQNKVDFG